MKIIKTKWFFEIEGGNYYNVTPPTLWCDRCDNLLTPGYLNIVHQLRDLLPDGFRHLCCVCRIKEKAGIEKNVCGCGRRMTFSIGNEYLLIYCSHCGITYYKGDLNGNRGKRIQEKVERTGRES